MDFFLEIYGNVLGDIALRNLSYSGIYLCGGITNSIKDYILENKAKFMVIFLIINLF